MCTIKKQHPDYFGSDGRIKVKAPLHIRKQYFIERAKKLFGSQIDYQYVNYIDDRSKVTLACHICGEFEQSPIQHLSGKGCPKCVKKISGKKQKLSLETVIKDFQSIHGDKYDYSKVDYINAHTKIKIICPKHGVFEQSQSNHKNGAGCPHCAGHVVTTESVIKEFREKHGDRYDYSLVDYINNRTKISIICLKHGIFEQAPVGHKKGNGCPECKIDNLRQCNTLSTDAIIEEFRQVHGNKFDYSLVEYVDCTTKVKIVCPQCGEFEQTPDKHKQGRGCLKCRGYEKTTKELIKEFRAVHGDTYDYSQVDYAGSKKKVVIVCPKHARFKQSPANHRNGNGCPTCSGNEPKTTEEAVRDFIKVHGNRYDYSLVDYVSSKVCVQIICSEHGLFEQAPSCHKMGQGCPHCSGNLLMTRVQVIDDFRKTHGDRYDYKLVDYVNNSTKVKIICRYHGVFEQTPAGHKSGKGCWDCSREYGGFWHPSCLTEEQLNQPSGNYVMLLECPISDEILIKVGITDNLTRRTKQITSQSGYKVTPLTYQEEILRKAFDIEVQLKKELRSYKKKPSVPFVGKNECFSTSAITSIVKMGIINQDKLPETLRELIKP